MVLETVLISMAGLLGVQGYVVPGVGVEEEPVLYYDQAADYPSYELIEIIPDHVETVGMMPDDVETLQEMMPDDFEGIPDDVETVQMIPDYDEPIQEPDFYHQYSLEDEQTVADEPVNRQNSDTAQVWKIYLHFLQH